MGCAESIINCFEKVFNKNYTRIYNWGHVKRNVRDDLKNIRNKEQRNEIIVYIDQLQFQRTMRS